jgi:acyl-coenzyme A synthetase/AMP-(fatty) acid ligase
MRLYQEEYQQSVEDVINDVGHRLSTGRVEEVVGSDSAIACSGKILRKVIRQVAQGESYAVPSTIDDPASLDEYITMFL